MKKVLAILLALSFSIIFVGCGEELGELSLDVTKSLVLSEDKINEASSSNFIDDGIGFVTFVNHVDGDTTTFKTSTSSAFKLRYYCINTPESTGKIEAWGRAASKYNKKVLSDALKNGGKIILECDPASQRQDSNKRYLGYVWYQESKNSSFQLLNLELVEQAFTKYFVSDSIYESYFESAANNAKKSNRRVYGETDPDFSYSNLATEVTLAYLIDNWDAYEARSSKISIEVLVTRICGEDLYVSDVDPTLNEDGEEAYGAMYVFSGYNFKPSSFLRVGDVVKFTCSAQSYNDSKQLSNVEFGEGKYTIISHDNPVNIENVQASDISNNSGLLDSLINKIVKMELTIEDVGSKDEEGNYTIYCHDEDGNNVNVRVNDGTLYSSRFFNEDNTYSFIGGLTKYYDTYQIVLGNNNLVESDVKKID